MSSEIKVDTISEKTSAGGVTIDGVKLKDNAVETNTISEGTSGSGVTIDSVLVKDGVAHSGLVKLSSATASGSSELTFDNFVDTSTYCYYYIALKNIRAATDGALLQITFRSGGASGADLNGSYYGANWRAYMTAATAGFDSNFSTTNYGNISDDIDSSAGRDHNGNVIFYPSDGTNNGTYMYADYCTKGNSGAIVSSRRNHYLDSTTASTGVRFHMSSGNIASGTVIVYGMKS
jgi:hypothetical protein